MDRNYPAPSFSDQLSSAGQPAAWAYERSAGTVKPSLNYGAETDLLHRQAYAVSHQLPGYATTHHPTGMHSSTELFVTGALPTSGTFPPTSALSAYQHPNTFTSRNFVTTPSLTLQDATFSATTNGLLTHDPILQIKASSSPVPTALAFDRLGSAVLSTSIPPQSSTYRSAQESAPHLLQPQFSLLPSALGGVQQASQPFSTSVFTGSTASIERALQRECSVIKHHQRPSSTLTVSQHSLPCYLSSGISFQDTLRQSTLTCSPLGDITQMSNGGPHQKTSQVSVELTQSYPSVIPSPGYPLSSTKAKNCAVKQPPRSSKNPKPQSVASPTQAPSYPKSAQNQSSVIASQTQIHAAAQLPSLLTVSQSQKFISSQSPNIPPVSHAQGFSSSKSETLPSLYKTLTLLSTPSQTITSDSPTLSYSSGQQPVPPSATDENYSDQTRDLPSANQSQSYPSSLSQGLSPVSQSQVSYSSQSQILSAVSPSESYTSGQNLTIASPSHSLPFSSSQVQNLSSSSPSQNYISLCASQNTQTQKSPPPQKFLPTVQSNFTSPVHSQTLQSRSASNTKSYAKRKSDSNLFASSKHDDEFPIQDLQALQQASLEPATQTLVEGEIGDQEEAYRVSKADDRYPQSVIRSHSRLEDEVGLTLQGCKKDVAHHISIASHDIKKVANLMQSSQVNVSAKELSQQQPLVHKVHETKITEHQDQISSTSAQIQAHAARQAQQLRLPSAQVLLESACDLHILQQSMLQSSLGQTKTSTQTHQIQSPQQAQFLQMDGHIIHSNGGQPQLYPQTSDVMKINIAEPSKHLQQHLTTKTNFSQSNQHDSKNQFVSLGSVCFPDSILLTDERNILSNVDDILAATAAACGVTPQEFAKSTSNEENPSLENAEDSKSRFQSIDLRRLSPNFSSSPAMVAKLQNMHNLSVNGSQMTVNLSSVSSLQSKNIILDQTNMEASDQTIRIGSPSTGIAHKEQEQISAIVKKRSSTSQESEEDNEILGNGRAEFASSGKSLSEESATSDNDFNMSIDDGNQTNGLLQPKTELQPSLCSGAKGDDENQGMTLESHQKREKGKIQNKSTAEDESGTQRQIKQACQSKRPNSKGTDMFFPLSPHIGESHDGYQHEERIRQKIKEVEEKQPEVKMGFIGSFLDFLKSGPKQQFSTPAVRMTNRNRRQSPLMVRAAQPPPPKPQPVPPAAMEASATSPPKPAEEEVKKNLEPLPSFSSDDEEDDSVGGSNDLQKSISTALSALDDTADKKNRSEAEKVIVKQESPRASSPVVSVQEKPKAAESHAPAECGDSSDELARSQLTVAVEGYTDEGNSDSGGEGMYRERDEFVVKIEDIESLKVALSAGKEPPAIWKVQKALLQKFVPEMRNGKREFSATNSYLGYFGDAKTKYKRVYVKFIENANKKEYVRVCSKKPRIKPPQIARPVHAKLANSKAVDPPALKSPAAKPLASKSPAAKVSSSSVKPKVKQPKVKAEPPPKKRKKWKEETPPCPSAASPEAQTDEDEFEPPAPFVTRFLNTRAMKETFKSYMELLFSIALDSDIIQALEKGDDVLLMPHMIKIDGMLNDTRRRLLSKLHLDKSFKRALDSFPNLTVISRETKTKNGGSVISKIKMTGKTYNKQTLRISKTNPKMCQEFAVDPERIHLCSLYHSLHHYKYHVYLRCKEEVLSLQKGNRDLRQEQILQLCMKNRKWLEELFEKFGDLLNHVQQKCL
ncbi:glutamine and serine-rich protein 1 isoform X2 [Rhinatrema bivittatum]|uniref:glutamine and serine-rich protein 1 isoform X2 n=1 Tax=Rhinatrema bivittatum TaxID=194408 RepID=UPI00112DE8D8|nr:glutamine and serine-rich protein 1 isoform X2 [Rhinatrema bivittatum]